MREEEFVVDRAFPVAPLSSEDDPSPPRPLPEELMAKYQLSNVNKRSDRSIRHRSLKRRRRRKKERRVDKRKSIFREEKSQLGHKQICLCRARQALATRASSHVTRARRTRERKRNKLFINKKHKPQGLYIILTNVISYLYHIINYIII